MSALVSQVPRLTSTDWPWVPRNQCPSSRRPVSASPPKARIVPTKTTKWTMAIAMAQLQIWRRRWRLACGSPARSCPSAPLSPSVGRRREQWDHAVDDRLHALALDQLDHRPELVVGAHRGAAQVDLLEEDAGYLELHRSRLRAGSTAGTARAAPQRCAAECVPPVIAGLSGEEVVLKDPRATTRSMPSCTTVGCS